MVHPLKNNKKSLIFDLQLAITKNNLNEIKSILNNNEIDLNGITFITKSTPLSFAIYHKLYEVIKLLLNSGSDPNRVSCDNLGRIEPPLCSAVRLGKYLFL
jgi:ankyrin repeat protein